MSGTAFNIHEISPYLGVLGIVGTVVLLVAAGVVMWQYRDRRTGGFQWSRRGWRLKQISAVACLFFLAMAASYWVIQEPLGWVYLLLAFKTGTWWFRRAISRGI